MLVGFQRPANTNSGESHEPQEADEPYRPCELLAPYPHLDDRLVQDHPAQRPPRRLRKAMEPVGEGLNGWQFAFKLAGALGKTAPAVKGSADVFALLVKEAKGYDGLTFEKLGKQGVVVEGAGVTA